MYIVVQLQQIYQIFQKLPELNSVRQWYYWVTDKYWNSKLVLDRRQNLHIIFKTTINIKTSKMSFRDNWICKFSIWFCLLYIIGSGDLARTDYYRNLRRKLKHWSWPNTPVYFTWSTESPQQTQKDQLGNKKCRDHKFW